MNRNLLFVPATLLGAFVLVGAGREPSPVVGKVPPTAISSDLATDKDQAAALRDPQPSLEQPPAATTAAPQYYLNWHSVNGGGATNVNGTNFDLGLSVGQAAAGFASGTNFKLGVGFWYGAAGAACPIALSGDLNNSGTVTSADIITLVNYVFKGGAAPSPCPAAGDVNCNGAVTSADIITLVNYVFKGGAAPCDICTIIPSVWSCP